MGGKAGVSSMASAEIGLFEDEQPGQRRASEVDSAEHTAPEELIAPTQIRQQRD